MRTALDVQLARFLAITVIGEVSLIIIVLRHRLV